MGQTVFFGMNLGAGVARIDQPGLARVPRLELKYDAVFGRGLTRRWAAGIELATWQPPDVDGTHPTFTSSPGVWSTPLGRRTGS